MVVSESHFLSAREAVRSLRAALLAVLLLPTLLVAADDQPGARLSGGLAFTPGKALSSLSGITGTRFQLFRDGRLESSSPFAGTVIAESPEARAASGAGRAFSLFGPMAQPQCTICLMGNASVSWSGSTGSFQVDQIANYRTSTTGNMDLKVVLTDTVPVWNTTISYYILSDAVTFNPLAPGYAYNGIDSGTVNFYGSSIPVGAYYVLLYLRNCPTPSSCGYADWVLFPSMVTCNGSGCTTAAVCTEDSYTMCLIGGRYRVTSYWKNQYAGGQVADLHRATLTNATGAFWLNNADTYEYLIRINTATDNGKAWIAIPTFTDVEFWIKVEDLVNGQSKTYHSPAGNRTLLYDPFYFNYP